MKRLLLVLTLIISFLLSNAQIKWDGGGDGLSWSDANNWLPNGIPNSTDNILLDNSSVLTNYTVSLPATAVTTSVNILTITPAAGITIQLTIPVTNTANPGLNVTGPGDALILNSGTILMNSTGVASGGIGLTITNTFRINNGGKYVHNNVRGNATIVSQLSTVAGTETGIFEFDVPGTVGFVVSLAGRTFGTLVFSAAAAGAPRTYTGNGATNLTIKGDLMINNNATFSSTMAANINLAGNLTINGNFDNNPSSAGTTFRSILFNGISNQMVSGAGNFIFGPNFRNIEVNPGSTVTLQRGINLSNAGNSFVVNNSGTLQMRTNIISGNGSFQVNPGAWLGIGSANGITAVPTFSGNVQTATRSFVTNASYEYNGGVGVTQVTGDGLPTTISGALKINTDAGMGTSGVTLSQNTTVSGVLDLSKGKLTSSVSGLLNIADNATAINYSTVTNNSFVAGRMKKTGDDDFVFPIGEGVEMHTFALTNVSGEGLSDEFQVEYFKANPQTAFGGTTPPGTNHMSALEYWMINRVAGSGAIAKKITLQATAYTDASNLTSLVVINNPAGSSWQNDGNSGITGGGSAGTVTSNNVTDFGSYTFASIVASENPLPITVLNFDASKLSNSQSSITWELGTVCSSAAFQIQRAGTGKGFETIGTVGGSTTDRLYNFIDNGLKNGVNYYRLKIIGEDGNSACTRIVAVMNGVNGLLFTSLIPTVINNAATLTVASSAPHPLDIFITDMQGRTLLKQNYAITTGNTNIELSLAGLAAGLYQLTGVTAEGRTQTIRFLKE